MARVSQKPLKKDVEARIRKNFVRNVVDLASTREGRVFLEDFLTETEQLMLAKRFAALMMIAEGVSSYRTWKILSMTPRTTARFSQEIESGRHKYVEKVVRDKHKREEFWKDVEELIRCGMPEMGRGRWRWLDELQERHK